MSARSIPHLLRQLVGMPLLAVSLAAAGVQLDLVADAVLGKPDMAIGTGGVVNASNLTLVAGMAEDPVTGAFWVVDESNHRVLRFSSAGAFTNGEAANLVLGQADFTSNTANRGSTAAANSLLVPSGVAVNQAGHVFVADTGNHRVLVYFPPHASGMDATRVLGQPDLESSAGNAGATPAANTLLAPRGLAIDRLGALYVADAGNNRVVTFVAPAWTNASAAKLFGQPDWSASAPATTATGLNGPWSVAIDAADNLWVADRWNNRALRYDLAATTGDATADVVLCQALFTTSASSATASTCNEPGAVAVDLAGVAYLTDLSNSRVLRFTTIASGASASAVIGQPDLMSYSCNQGTGEPSATRVCNPWTVIVDRAGNVILGDRGNARVLRYDLPRPRIVPALASMSPERMPQRGTAFTLTVNGTGFYANSVVNWNGSPRATQYLSPQRLVAQIPAADIVGSGPFAVTVTNAAPGGGISLTVNLATYPRPSLDNTADRVLGQPNFTSNAGNNPQVGEEQVGGVSAATFRSLEGTFALAVDPKSGRLFVIDSNASRVMSWPSVSAFHNAQSADVVLGQANEFEEVCATEGAISARTLCRPVALAVDAYGALYVSDTRNNRVLRFAPPFSTGMAATRVFGQGGSFTTNASNNGGIGANSLWIPIGLATSGSRLFVYDAGNSRILAYDNAALDFTADLVIGQAGMTTVDAPVTSSTRLGAAGTGFGLAIDASGNLFFVHMGANRVLRFPAPLSDGMAADLVIGQPDFQSASAATSATGLRFPTAVALDPGGNLLVADFLNNRVLRYATPLSSTMAATGVLGQADFVSSTGGTSATMLAGPAGVAFDRLGNLVVADMNNARVLAFDRPFAFTLDPAADIDGDGIPNGVEVAESRDPYAMDNDVFGNARLFAMQQYRDFLNREGDVPGIAGWTSLVGSGSYSRNQVIDAFLSSDEFAGFVSPVVRLYFATFLRVPDYDGLTFNAGLVRNGTVTLTQLADYFTVSPEFDATYGALDDTAFVTLLYNNVLGRVPDWLGLSGWVSLLGSGYTRGQVLLGFSDSVEYQARMANEVFVTMMYAGMLRRTPEPAGFNGWVGFLDAATYTREQVINGFFLSTEYHGRFLP